MYPIINTLVLLTFAWLCYAAQPEPYDTKGVDRLLAEYQPLTFKQRQARALREVYEVSDDQEPIAIFTTPKRR